MNKSDRMELCPLQEKFLLTVDEAAAYFNICADKLREISANDDCRFVLCNGSKRLFKRKALEEYLDNQDRL